MKFQTPSKVESDFEVKKGNFPPCVFALPKAHLLDTLASRPDFPPTKTFFRTKIFKRFVFVFCTYLCTALKRSIVEGIVVLLKGCHKHLLVGD